MGKLLNYLGESKILKRIADVLNVTDVKVNGASVVDSAGIANIDLSLYAKFEVVQTLPASGESGIIYLVPKTTAQSDNVYDEYVWTEDGWELIGSTDIDLSDYYTKTESDNRYVQPGDLAAVATSGDYDDLNDKPIIPDELSDLADDSTHRLVTDTEKSTWNATAVYKELSNQDLNTINEVGFYVGKSGNTCTNKPTGVAQFGLIVVRTATSQSTYFKQILIAPTGEFYHRRQYGASQGWNNWEYMLGVDWASNGILGSKNLNSYPYYETTHTEAGITWTDNADGTVTANGTSTGNSSFICHSRITGRTNPLILPNGKYILSGCPSGGSANTYRMVAYVTKNGSASALGTDYGEGVVIEVNGDDNFTDKAYVQTGCDIRSTGYVANNLKFKPMIRLASDTDDTFQPYSKTNLELTEYTKTNDNRLSPKEPEPANQDLNDYKESGVYYFTAGNAPLNVPIGSNGMLVVFKAVTDSSQDYILVKQIWLRHGTQNSNDYHTYIRTYRTDLNTWSNWHRVITSEGGSISGNLTIVVPNTETTSVNSGINLGNNIPEGTEGTTRGVLNIYGIGANYVQFVDGRNVAITGNRTLYLPDKTGVLAVSEDLNLTQLNERSLFYPPYYRANGYTYREVTYTYTSDGTLTANGTATGGNSNFHYRVYASNQYIKGGKAYYFKACPSGGSDSKYWGELSFGDDNNTTLLTVKDYGSGVYVIAPKNAVKISSQFVIKSGYTVDNLSFKPKLVPYDGWVELGSITETATNFATNNYKELKAVFEISYTSYKKYVTVFIDYAKIGGSDTYFACGFDISGEVDVVAKLILGTPNFSVRTSAILPTGMSMPSAILYAKA